MVEPDPFILTGEQRRQAARLVASKSRDATDCGELLAMLGLTTAPARPGTAEAWTTTFRRDQRAPVTGRGQPRRNRVCSSPIPSIRLTRTSSGPR
jgi:hypothetical protein